MRMLNPSPGEVVDRQTILDLKSEHGQSLDQQKTEDQFKVDTEATAVVRTRFEGASKINIKPFLDEHEALQRYLEKNYFPILVASPDKQQEFDKLYEEIHEVNSDIWKLEDQARILRDSPDKNNEQVIHRAAEVLFTINDLNDKRSELVKKVDAIWGMAIQEKFYC